MLARWRDQRSGRQRLGVQLLRRWNLGTSYPAITDSLAELCRTPPLPGSPLAVDQTGVGRAVVDSLRLLGLPCPLVPVTITAGMTTNRAEDGSGWRVPKKDLVTALQMPLQSGRLHVSPALPLAGVLVAEMQAFRVKVTAAGNETLESWREKDHDDLVLAVAMACWAAERFPLWEDASAIGTRQHGLERNDVNPLRNMPKEW